MARNLFAFMVGINNYQAPVPRLSGCTNDIDAFESYLSGRTAKDQFNLQLLKLMDEQATRQAVIDGFRKHLHQAGKDDVALFYYSGHGSQETAPEEFWALEPDHMDETLVCYDSRQLDGWDLADKELAYLIHEVAENGPHMVVILDCCHSGSGTRDVSLETSIRWAPADQRERSVDSFLFTRDLSESTRIMDTAARPKGWMDLPEGRHILMAACRDDETAKEYYADGRPYGAFSYFLRSTLESANGPLTYRDLFKQAQSRVRSNLYNQSPQLETTQSSDLDLPFLGGALLPRPENFTLSFDGSEWMLDAGSIHGIPAPFGDETTQLVVFPLDAQANDLLDITKALGQVDVVQVYPQASRLRVIDLELDPTKTYKAIVVNLPLPLLEVKFEGDEEALALVREAMKVSAPGGKPSLYIREMQATPRLRLLTKDSAYTITNPGEDRPLVSRLYGYELDNATKVVQRLEHIARWMRTMDLQNPGSRLAMDAIQMSVLRDGVELSPNEMTFDYQFRNGRWEQPSYSLRLKNNSSETLYCAVLGLYESFSIEVVIGKPTVRLGPGEEFNAQKYLSIPDEVWQQGIAERQDVLKLIVSTDEFDANLLAQGKLDIARTTGPTQRGMIRKNSLNRLMNKVQTRESSDTPEGQSLSDWITSQAVLRIRKPLETREVPRAGEALSLGAGVTLDAHPALVAQARLGSLPPASRGAEGPGLPEIFRVQAPENQPYYFRLTRGITSENVLELSDVVDHTVVTPQKPLRMTIANPLAKGEGVLAFGFDGEFYLPLGAARAYQNQTLFDLQRLPAPVSLGGRDVKGAVRIYFQKVIGQPLGIDYPYPILAAATVSPDGRVTYEADLSKITALVNAARRITLYIHGITGDTRGMVSSARQTNPGDLLLTFDYESLNTTVEEIARSLKDRLAKVGLKAGHGKELRVVAHSLGGIIARWLIEKEGGQQVINKLVILGSPSAGTPWATIQQWATVGLGLALNGLAATLWPVKVISLFLAALEKVDVTLDQVQPGSEVLKSLAVSDDPHVPYVLIAGNTSLLSQALEGEDTSKAGKLMSKLGYPLASLGFLKQPNDIAVGVTSVHSVDNARQPAPEKSIVASDHLSFFTSEPGLAALKQWLA
jgi:pimeloyl-ACP methyl ester carboxylesterase